MVYKLLKALYRCKQSLQLWYKKLLGFLLEKFGLAYMYVDHTIFLKKIGLNRSILDTFIDNIKIMALKKSEIIQCIKVKLIISFSIVNMGYISFYLGLKVK